MENCIFCQIAKGESPAEVEYEDPEVIAFWDVHPKAKTHILIIPKKHIESVEEMEEQDFEIFPKMYKAAREVARKKKLSAEGYRFVINQGKNAGQVVDHLHMHLLGGGKLGSIA